MIFFILVNEGHVSGMSRYKPDDPNIIYFELTFSSLEDAEDYFSRVQYLNGQLVVT